MKSNRNRLHAALLAFGVFAAGGTFAQQPAVKTFATYQEAASAYIAAVTADDKGALNEILGAQSVDLLSSGDAEIDAKSRQAFLKAYAAAHSFVHDAPGRVTITIGKSAWPIPMPIVRADGRWHFDAEAGAQEIAYRRIGHNELDSIKVCMALKDAQRAYAAVGHDGDSAGVFAQRFLSDAGKQNGLYWEVGEGEPESPAGVLVADAASERGNDSQSKGARAPFHGYYFRILKAQGEHAPGGAKDYVVDGKMTGGFAILAYPAEYGRSGVMTFMVANHGRVYQKDLGESTEEAAKQMTAFDPDSSWRPAP
jgi:hypothetical protein